MTWKIRVASWNVREGIRASEVEPKHRAQEIVSAARLVRDQDIDVLALQEVDFDRNGDSAVLSGLLEATELHYVAAFPLSDSSFEPGKRAGVAIASRLPIDGVAGHFLPNPHLAASAQGRRYSTHDKGYVRCAINVGFTRLVIASIHGFPFHRFGRRADEPQFADIWRSIPQHLQQGEDQDLILCGDFNTEDRRLLVDSFDAPLAAAFTGFRTHNNMAIDDVLFSAGLRPATTPKVLENFSDHHLCIATFTSR
jgi:endonuclease/exonuclease/phosphatase family metal-dependent hydrolase